MLIFIAIFTTGVAIGGISVGIIMLNRGRNTVDQIERYHYKTLYAVAEALPENQRAKIVEIIAKEYGNVSRDN